MRLSNEKRKQIRELYVTGNFTRPELGRAFGVTGRTISNIVRGIKKPFKYDAMDIAISLDMLKERGFEIADYTNDPYTRLTKGSEYTKVVVCPEEGCNYRSTANHLLKHLINKHKRFDLEYLL